MFFRRLIQLTCFLCAIYDTSCAQEIPQSGYPLDYFRVPVDLPVHLAGNFGELRPDHFHMGLDIKTNGRIGYPVYAAADGYIAHVKVEPFGFGNAIYINHPNGYTTVYVHLDHFIPALQRYVKERQYSLERWEVYLDIPPDLFPVKKGEIIAASGNTGGSLAPHLHFEIRDTRSDENRNPLLFGLPITDNMPPVLYSVGVYDGNESVYLQVPRVLPLVHRGDTYSIPGGLLTTRSGKLRLAIGAVDYQTGSSSKLGIYSAYLYMDGSPIGGFVLDKFGYDLTRYVNAHMDYSLKMGKGLGLEFLSPLPGDLLPVYAHTGEDGMLDLKDDQPHEIRIDVKDAFDNSSRLVFTIRKSGPPPFYDQGGLFLPGQVNVFENDKLLLYLPEHCLYDEVRPVFEKKEAPDAPGTLPGSPFYSVLSGFIPAQDSFTVSIRPDSGVAIDTGNFVIQVSGPGESHVGKVVWSRGWATARLRNFGTFRLLRDLRPPDLTPLGWRDGASLRDRREIAMRVTDNLGSTKDFRAELDGKWLMFRQVGQVYTYDFDDHFPSGEHVLTLSVADEAGNVTRKTYHLTR